jgi:Domain of unknown function (DUF6443)
MDMYKKIIVASILIINSIAAFSQNQRIPIDGQCVRYGFIDKDNDNYGTGSKICLDTADDTWHYSTRPGDCDDNNPNITISKFWYLDSDRDGFGNTPTSAKLCSPPSTSYIAMNGDCNDANAAINPNTQWYQDNDGDGFGNNSVFIKQCTKPAMGSYTLNNTDCNDSNSSITLFITWYQDADNDGFGNGAITLVQCAQPVGYVSNNQDCNDSNNTITLGSTWYADTDLDGFGDPAVAVVACGAPINYVANQLDNCPTVAGSISGCIVPVVGGNATGGSTGFSSDMNFIITSTPKVPVKNLQSITDAKDVTTAVTYFDGLGRPIQNVAIAQGTNRVDNNLLDWKKNWRIGSGSAPSFNQNGTTAENVRINGANPYGKNSVLWQCVNDAISDDDGGWNTAPMAVDVNTAYQYAVWVKRTGSQNGLTYHGTQNVLNLDGTANNNPYFWYGNLPQLDQWYLMVGMIHPASYTGGYSGISGVYDMAGNKVLNGSDFKWNSATTLSYFRSYLYYSTDVSVRQYFYNPIVQKIDGSQASIKGLTADSDTRDIVTHIEYDAYGRQEKEYLPYADLGTGAGNYKTNALPATLSYYNRPQHENTLNPYSQKLFEASPLNRVLEQAAPGNAWSLNNPNKHTVRLGYETNTATEVKKYMVTSPYTAAQGLFDNAIADGGNYEPNQLYKTVTKDENWFGQSGLGNSTEEFKDKEGHVVLKRTHSSMGRRTVAHDTYYVYDIRNNLVYVIPPLAEGAIDQNTLDGLCY